MHIAEGTSERNEGVSVGIKALHRARRQSEQGECSDTYVAVVVVLLDVLLDAIRVVLRLLRLLVHRQRRQRRQLHVVRHAVRHIVVIVV